MNSFEIVASSTESTVVTEYTPEKRKSTDYQSEAELEQDFINRLVSKGDGPFTVYRAQHEQVHHVPALSVMATNTLL